jgi:hypothetical protein
LCLLFLITAANNLTVSEFKEFEISWINESMSTSHRSFNFLDLYFFLSLQTALPFLQIVLKSFRFLGVKSDAAKLCSFSRECLALGFEDKFWSLKHLNSPSEASKLKEQDVFHRKYEYVGCCLYRIWYRDWRRCGRTIYVERKSSGNTDGGTRQPAIGFQGWQDLKGVWFWSNFGR